MIDVIDAAPTSVQCDTCATVVHQGPRRSTFGHMAGVFEAVISQRLFDALDITIEILFQKLLSGDGRRNTKEGCATYGRAG